jgi:hypothetical protein
MDWVPGVVVAVIELAILLYYFTDFSYKAKSTVWKRLRIYVLVTLLSLLTWAVFDNLFLRTIFVILFLALAFMQMYTGNKWFIAFYVVTCVLVMLFTEVMVNTGIKALLWGLYHINHFAFEFTCVLFTKFITVLLLFLMKKVMRRIIFKKPLMKDLGFMLMQTMTSILFFVFAGVYTSSKSKSNAPVSAETAGFIWMCSLFIVILFLIGLFYTEYLTGIHHRDLLLEEELEIARMRSVVYKNQIDREDRIRSMYHDMKNHLLVLKNNALKPDEYAGYLSELEEKMSAVDDHIHTGNSYLDILLQEKRSACEEDDIKLDAQINLCGNLLLSPVEICILFGNLLDNAMEANKQINSTAKRRIDIVAHKKNNSFVIKVVNPYEKPVKWSDGGIVTTKRNQYEHGFGLKNIAKIVHEKKGQYSIRTEHGDFQICILLPLEEA